MRMSFSGLNIALSGLQTSQKALNVASHNISNAGTPGYSRQIADISVNAPFQAYGSGMIGTGSDVTNVTRVRDDYTDYRYWNENGNYGEWDIKQSSLADLEALLSETKTSGFNVSLSNFYSSLQELTKDPSSVSAREAFKENAISLANQFNTTATKLQEMQRDNNFGVKTEVDQINSYATQIRDLNNQIYKSELDGSTANDLRDQRQVLVDKLSKIVNIDVQETSDTSSVGNTGSKKYTISINGHVLVNHDKVNTVQYIQRTTAQRGNPSDIDGLYNLQWDDGNEFNFGSGELKGYIDIRDGNGDVTTGSMNAYKGVPYYLDKLNYFARTFAQTVNEGVGGNLGSTDGYGLDGSTGIKLFTTDSSMSAAFTNYATLTAGNISVSGDILANNGINKIPASDVTGSNGNANILQQLLDQRHAKIFAEGAPEDYMKTLTATLGVDSQEAQKMSNLQEVIVNNIDNKRDSTSGVSIDEEMTNIVKFQQIYSASAKLISIISSLYDTTINELGKG